MGGLQPVALILHVRVAKNIHAQHEKGPWNNVVVKWDDKWGHTKLLRHSLCLWILEAVAAWRVPHEKQHQERWSGVCVTTRWRYVKTGSEVCIFCKGEWSWGCAKLEFWTKHVVWKERCNRAKGVLDTALDIWNQDRRPCATWIRNNQTKVPEGGEKEAQHESFLWSERMEDWTRDECPGLIYWMTQHDHRMQLLQNNIITGFSWGWITCKRMWNEPYNTVRSMCM